MQGWKRVIVTPISPNTPAPQNQPTERKKSKRQLGSEQIIGLISNCPCSYLHHRILGNQDRVTNLKYCQIVYKYTIIV